MSTSTNQPGGSVGKQGGTRGGVERLRRKNEDDPAAQLAREQTLRHEAEAARATLRTIFESVPGSCIVLTPDDEYHIVGATEAYLQATMTRRADIIERPLFEVFPNDPDEPGCASVGVTRASLERVRENRASHVMGVHRFPIPRPREQGNGFEERYWSSINAPVLNKDGELLYIIHRVEDVTEYVRSSRSSGEAAELDRDALHVRRQMEAEIVQRALDLQAANERLRESEARYRELIQALPAAIYTCDAQGRVDLYNETAIALWGREPEPRKTLWCGSWRIYRPEGSELPLDQCPMARAIREGRFVRGEIVIERPDRTRRKVEANATPILDDEGRVTGAVNLLVDRTEQSRAEEAQAHLAAIVDSSGDAIVSKDLDGMIRSWNGGAERIFGYGAEEMIGQPIARIIPPELQSEEQQILASIRRGERVENLETVRVSKDGGRIDVSLSISPVYNASGQVIGASKIARDVTESKRIARALAEADRRKDQFLAMLAHELRNPLAALASGVELLALPNAPENLESTRGMLDRQTQHLKRLVDDLMDMSRISRGMVSLRPETLDARSVVERAVEAVRLSVGEQRHSLRIALDEQPLRVKADPTRLEQLVANLLTNAAKFTKPGGRIEVGAYRRDEAALFYVRDNGVGIAPELLPHIFDLFAQSEQSADRATGGLGIGLTLVKSIAELHGGTVEARSEGPGQGAEFRVILPLAEPVDEDLPRLIETGSGASGEHGSARRVLVVDDNEDAALGLSRLLEYSGHVVRQAYTGPAALETAAEFRPEAVLLDIGLPDLDGYEVARRLRADTALEDVLLIALSGYCQDEDRRRSREAGFDHHVAKPVAHSDILRLLEDTAR